MTLLPETVRLRAPHVCMGCSVRDELRRADGNSELWSRHWGETHRLMQDVPIGLDWSRLGLHWPWVDPGWLWRGLDWPWRGLGSPWLRPNLPWRDGL
jgi:hypothetical protein